LRDSIGKLQSASIALDVEKVEAEKKFRELLDRLPVSRRGQARCIKGRFRWIADWIKWVYGVRSVPTTSWEEKPSHSLEEEEESWTGYLASAIYDGGGYYWQGRHTRYDGGFPMDKFRKAAKRVQKANQKLISFERGFISEEGIKDRTWYRHLVVAPGKWLGESPSPCSLIIIFFLNDSTRLWCDCISCTD